MRHWNAETGLVICTYCPLLVRAMSEGPLPNFRPEPFVPEHIVYWDGKNWILSFPDGSEGTCMSQEHAWEWCQERAKALGGDAVLCKMNGKEFKRLNFAKPAPQ
jgi:hypothetical protein